MQGRPRKPTTVHKLTGTFRKDRHNENEPQPEQPEKLEPPEWLDDFGRECWQTLTPHLLRLGLLTSVDLPLFAALCERYAMYRRAVDALTNQLTQITANGECARPQVAIAKTAFDQLKSALQEFGLSPASRSKAVATKAPEDDPIAQYQRKNGVHRFLA